MELLPARVADGTAANAVMATLPKTEPVRYYKDNMFFIFSSSHTLTVMLGGGGSAQAVLLGPGGWDGSGRIRSA